MRVLGAVSPMAKPKRTYEPDKGYKELKAELDAEYAALGSESKAEYVEKLAALKARFS